MRAYEIDNRFTKLNDLRDDDIAELAASSRLRGLCGLDLEDARHLTIEAFVALARTTNLPALNAVICKLYEYSQIETGYGPMGPIKRAFLSNKVAAITDDLERRCGRQEWLHVEQHYGLEPIPEAIVAHSVRTREKLGNTNGG